MNKDQTKEAIKVMQAYVDGEEIEYKDSSGAWRAVNGEPLWNFCECEYRVKPKPLECYLVVDNLGSMAAFSSDAPAHAFIARASDCQGLEGARIIKMREVTE